MILAVLCALALGAVSLPAETGPGHRPDSVVIGVLLPANDARAASDLAAGIRLRVDDAATNGDTLRVRLVVRTLETGWSAGRTVVQMAFDDGVHAVIGGVDGRAAHVIEQLVAKRRMPLVSPWASDPSLTASYVPWMYRAVPSDRAQAHALWSVIPKDGGPVSVLAADDYDAQTAARTFVAEGIAAGRAATVVPAVSRDAATAHSAGGQWSAPVALFGSPEWAARRVRDLRDRGVTGHAVGWLRMANERFIDAAGAAAEGVTVVAPAHWHTAAGSDFDVAFAARFGRRPSPLAAYAYDAANALLQAIDDGEVDPDALRDRLQRAVTHGVTGPMAFDEHGNREGPVRLAVVRRGAFAPLER